MESLIGGGVSRFFRRRWRWLVAGLVLMVMVTFGAGLYLGRIVERRLADAIAAADRDDRYWRIEDLMSHREVVPDAENSALVLAKVLPLMPESWPNAPEPKSGGPTPPAQEAKDAFERLSAAADNIRLDEATAGVLRDELKKFDEAIRIARTVSAYRRGRHELKLGPMLFDTLLPETESARAVTRLLAADAAIRAHDGDLDGALDLCCAVLGVARSIGDEPFAVSQLIRIVIDATAMKSARRVLAQGEPSDAALARLQALIVDELDEPILLHSMRGERAIHDGLIQKFEAGEIALTDLSDVSRRDDLRKALRTMAPWGKLMFDNQRAVGLEWMNAAVAIAQRPAAERPALWDAWDADVSRVRGSWFGIATSTVPILMVPVMLSVGSADSRIHCELGATAVLLAAERHRRKAGDWPAAIAAIDRSILPGAPVDPFSEEAFRMERREERLWIYSIGPNRKDEHGAYEPKQWGKGGPDDVGAIGWDVAARRRPPPLGDERHDRSSSSP